MKVEEVAETAKMVEVASELRISKRLVNKAEEVAVESLKVREPRVLESVNSLVEVALL